MNNKEFAAQLEKRTKTFAINIIKMSSSIHYTPENKILRNQLTKSGTSIGANYRQANRSRSKADFLNKIRICEGEANETTYWLEIIQELNLIDYQSILLIIKESFELLAIFTSIRSKLKSKQL